jgi:hypothetical protein
MEVENGVLHILADNNGWGTAHDCHVRVMYSSFSHTRGMLFVLDIRILSIHVV